MNYLKKKIVIISMIFFGAFLNLNLMVTNARAAYQIDNTYSWAYSGDFGGFSETTGIVIKSVSDDSVRADIYENGARTHNNFEIGHSMVYSVSMLSSLMMIGTTGTGTYGGVECDTVSDTAGGLGHMTVD